MFISIRSLTLVLNAVITGKPVKRKIVPVPDSPPQLHKCICGPPAALPRMGAATTSRTAPLVPHLIYHHLASHAPCPALPASHPALPPSHPALLAPGLACRPAPHCCPRNTRDRPYCARHAGAARCCPILRGHGRPIYCRLACTPGRYYQ